MKHQLQKFPLGCTTADNQTYFRLFAPKAVEAEAIIFQRYEDEDGLHIPLSKNEVGVWEGFADGNYTGKWYVYVLQFPDDMQDPLLKYPVADPWSTFVTTRNHHLQYPKTRIIPPSQFDWEGDDFIAPKDPRDLIIYEAHIKDMAAHPSAKTRVRGIYNDFCDAETGGISHLKKLGVNAVEFLPLQKFAYFEPPYNEKTDEGITNTWNPYARNHWGYMTSFFLAPETLYASDASLQPDAVVGKHEVAIDELKRVVKTLHREGITVIMDVVYNHASHYDLNPLKQTAKEEFFRLDEYGNYRNDSWTGNDLKTESPHMRELIVESIKYWMNEFHIDGFRFDLAGLIDHETVELIRKEAQKINPHVLLIAEPWGGEYSPAKYSERGWPSWNDRIRNAFKGYDPAHDKGYIFGNIKEDCTRFALENFIRGTILHHDQGLYQTSAHSVNYLESHDGYTLGDYIRIALNPEKANATYSGSDAVIKLNPVELKTTKFAALALFVCQGITMMHAGQEWARSKVITGPLGIDPNAGRFDHDSYNKDNETNWLNFSEINYNKQLFEYYKGLIQLRLNAPALRKAAPDDIQFKIYSDPLHITFSVNGGSSEDKFDYFVSLNANPEQSQQIVLAEGYWEVIADENKAGAFTFDSVKNNYTVSPAGGIVLRKLRVSKA